MLAVDGLALAICSLGARAASAHHAFTAEWDASAPRAAARHGEQVECISPHAWVHMMVKQPGKPDSEWMVEGGTPNTLLRAGLTKASLKPGSEVIVRSCQSKDRLCSPACKANGRDVPFTDGRKVLMGSSGTGAPKDCADAAEAPH